MKLKIYSDIKTRELVLEIKSGYDLIQQDNAARIFKRICHQETIHATSNDAGFLALRWHIKTQLRHHRIVDSDTTLSFFGLLTSPEPYDKEN